jgi:cytochrome c biogenesis protein CcmG/thiol:disulfide interchange protein DsbE
VTVDADSDETASRRFTRHSSRKRTLIGLGVITAIALIAVVSVLTGGKVTNGNVLTTSALVGHRLKSFSLNGLNGGEVQAPWDSGRASVIVFFASYCGPCQGEMPKIAKYLRANSPSPVEVLAVDASDERAAAQAMVKKDGVTFRVAFDPNAVVSTGIFGFQAVPESVFVSAKGIVTGVYYGAIPEQQLATAIHSLKTEHD